MKTEISKLSKSNRFNPGKVNSTLKKAAQKAFTMEEQINPNRAATRVCLKCNEKFESRWAGNRICKKCARINAGLGPIPEAVLAKQRGSKRHNGLTIGDTSDLLPS